MSEKAIVVENLYKIFGDFKAVNDVSFTVGKGEIFGFLGSNGAGKSTTIRMLCGILEPTNGTGIVAGYNIATQARTVRQNIGYMGQKFSLYEELTVIENIKFFAKLYNVPKDVFNERISETIELVKLQGYEHKKTISLSAGIKQRLSLACAILHRPSVLFLDEPTAGVDPISRRNFWDLIYSFSANGVTIFVTTHYMDEAEYCDRIAMISAGKLQQIGTPEELKTSKMRLDVFSLTGNDLHKISNTLSGMKGVYDVAILADSIRVLTKGIAQADIESILQNSQTHFEQLSATQATLEDVFVSLSGVLDEY